MGDYHLHGDYSTIGPTGPVRTADPARDQYNSDNWSEQDLKGIVSDAVDRSVKAMVDNFRNPVAHPDFKQDYRGYLGTPSGTFKVFAPFAALRANLVIDPNLFRYKPAAPK